MVQQQNTTPCVSNFSTEVRAKESERELISIKTAEYLSAGMQIQNIKAGVSGVSVAKARWEIKRCTA